MDATQIMNILKYAWPIIALQLAVQVYTLYDLLKKKKVKNLSVGVWAVIIVVGEIVGAAVYFLLGRTEEQE